MNIKMHCLLAAVALCAIGGTVSHAQDEVPFHRFYNSDNNDHFYTLDPGPFYEYSEETSPGYVFPYNYSGTERLYRYYNSTTHLHFYSANPGSEDLSGYGLETEGIYVYGSEVTGSTPLYRYVGYDGAHLYTSDPGSEDLTGYTYEHIECYVLTS
jgi:hypothetical protein